MSEVLGIHDEAELSIGAQLHERIVYWKHFFDTAPISDCKQRQLEAVSELDQLLDQNETYAKTCIVNGTGVWSEIVDIEQEPDDYESTIAEKDHPKEKHLVVNSGQIVNKHGQNRGFAVQSMTGAERKRLWCMFDIGNFRSRPHPTIGQDTQLLMFVEPENMSIIAIDSFEESDEVGDIDQGESVARLTKYSQQLVSTVVSTGFRRLKREKQAATIDEIIKAAERDTNIRRADLLLEGHYGYLSKPYEGVLVNQFTNIAGYMLIGACLGITMAGREFLDIQAIRRDAHLLNKYDGLAIAIEINTIQGDKKHPLLKAGDLVKVPISGQDLEVVFDPYSVQI